MTRRLHLIVVGAVWLGCGSAQEAQPKPAAQQTPAPASAETTHEAPPAPPEVRPAPDTATRAEPITFEIEPLGKGAVRVETVKISQHSVMQAREGKTREYMERRVTHEFRSRLEVLEADATGPTRAKVVYESREDEEPGGNTAARLFPHPAVNTPYVLTREGAKILAEHDDGTKLSPPEARAVIDANFAFAVGRFAGLLPSGSLKPGDEFELDEAKVAPLLESRPRLGHKVLFAKLTYRGIADDGALFDLDVRYEQLEGVLRSTMELSGELLFDPKSGALVRGTCQGPIVIRSETGAHGGATIAGDGAITIDASVELTRPS